MTRRAADIALTRDFAGRVPQPRGRWSSAAELQRLARTFNHMLESLEEAHAMQQRFLADASHELRTPLTALRANLDYLASATDAPPGERAQALNEAREETERMSRLVSDLLALSRADTGQSFDRARVELDRVIVDAYRRAQALSNGVQMSFGRLDEAVVMGDAERLSQMVMILLDNAVKYTPTGGEVTVSLTRDVAEHGSRSHITVLDTGMGVAAEDRARIFERFYRSAAARSLAEGSGLGLPIARWIAHMHGGDIEVADGSPGGSRFVVTLPGLAAAPEEEITQQEVAAHDEVTTHI